MPTINTSLQLFNNVYAALVKVNQTINITLNRTERLRGKLQRSVTLIIDITEAMDRIERVRRRIRTIDGSITLRAVLDTNNILRSIKQVRQRIGNMRIRVLLDAANVLAQAVSIRKDLEARLKIELPSSLKTMLQSLRSLVQNLVRAVGQLRSASKGLTQQQSGAAPAMQKVVALLHQMIALQQQLGQLQNQPADAAKKSENALGGWLGKLKGIVGQYLSIQSLSEAAKKIGEVGSAMQTQENQFGTRLGDLKLGKRMMATLVHQANELNVSATELGQTWNGFLPLAQNVGQLKQMAEWTNRLARLDPAQGLEGASAAMKEVMSGDAQSLVDSYNIPQTLADQLTGAAKTGNFDQLGAAIEQVFGKLNLTRGQMDALNAQPFNQLKGDIEVLGNLFSVFSLNAVTKVAELYVWFKEHIPAAIQKTIAFFSGLWAAVSPVLSVVVQGIMIAGALYLGYLLILAAAAVVSAAIAAAAWIAANWPLLLIIAIVIAVIAIFMYFGGTVSDVVGGMVGILFFLGAVIWDAIAVIIKLVIDLVLSLGESFLNMAAGAVKAIELVGNAILSGLVNTIDFAIRGINQLLNLLNHIPGVKIPNIPSASQLGIPTSVNLGSNQLANMAQQLGQFRQKAISSVPMLNPIDSYNAGFGYGKGMTDSAIEGAGNLGGKLKGMIGGLTGMFKVDSDGLLPDDTLLGGGLNINNVNNVDHIKDTVDVSSEDLKVMRDIAEMKNIQNFVSLTPSVTIGEVHQYTPTDVDVMMENIKRVMEKEVANTAKGVYEL
ncbi:hypothetical protein [Paenibacillus ginsengarvi]|uniref:Phage tail tape measure protein n=1 Tax=Paenibacillus ginsengarvi TaxID=400777 RepID=A0A3B0CNB5_9BACL|nr:hypothetical protein [Paenibacillus ginsengarvi]RKN85867.1 hypothetical protein D7M11_05905 [Paenibacillus ginsengarvi]